MSKVKGPQQLYPVDITKFEEAANDLHLYHALILHAYEEAVQNGIEPELVHDLKLQADMVQEILLKFKVSVVNGANYDPGGKPQIH